MIGHVEIAASTLHRHTTDQGGEINGCGASHYLLQGDSASESDGGGVHGDEGGGDFPFYSGYEESCDDNQGESYLTAGKVTSENVELKDHREFDRTVVSYLKDGKFHFNVMSTTKRSVSGLAEDYAALDLIQMLEKARCPRYLFNSIVQWSNNCHRMGCHPGVIPFPLRDTFTNGVVRSMNRAGITIPAAKTVSVELETIYELEKREFKVSFPVWDFKEQLHSLLSDMSIFGDIENLNVNKDAPFTPLTQEDPQEEGRWYFRTIKDRGITGHDGRFLVPLVFAIDRSNITGNERHGVEPLLFTTSLIKRDLWEYPHVWRPLALIPATETEIGRAAGGLGSSRVRNHDSSSTNYHRCLDLALESVIEFQERGSALGGETEDGGAIAMLSLGEYKRPMKILCPVRNILADGLGADKLTSRDKSTKNIGNPRISRGCDCHPDDCSSPFHLCKPLNMSEISSYFHKNKSDEEDGEQDQHAAERGSDSQNWREDFRNKYALHPVANAFWRCDFGSSPGGIYTASKVDPMHAFSEGMWKYCLTGIFGNANQNKKGRMMIDEIARNVLENAPRQSSRSRFPRLVFSGGITSITKLACHEWVGLAIAVTLLSSMTFRDRRQKMLCRGIAENDTSQIKHRFMTLQVMCLFQAWIDNGPFDNLQSQECGVETYVKLDLTIRTVAWMILEYIPREEGHGWEIQKFHDLFVHVLEGILECGLGKAIDTGVSEKMHKWFAKSPAATSLKHSQEIFLAFVGRRITEAQFLAQYRAILGIPESVYDEECSKKPAGVSSNLKRNQGLNSNDDNSSVDVEVEVALQASCICSVDVVFDERTMSDIITVKWQKGANDRFKLTIEETETLESAFTVSTQKYLLENDSGMVDGKYPALSFGVSPQAKLRNQIFRAHPNYQSRGKWYDWCLIQWDTTWSTDKWQPAKKGWSSSSPSTIYGNEILMHLSDHVDCRDMTSQTVTVQPSKNDEIEYYVPARILGFARDPEDFNKVLVWVHSCDSECTTTSMMTRRWKLAYSLKDSFHLLPVDVIACPIYVIEEEPGFLEARNVSARQANCTYVVEVFDRKVSWGKRFHELSMEGMAKLIPNEHKKEHSRLAKKFKEESKEVFSTAERKTSDIGCQHGKKDESSKKSTAKETTNDSPLAETTPVPSPPRKKARMTPYACYALEMGGKAKEDHPDASFRQIRSIILQGWKDLPADNQERYKRMSDLKKSHPKASFRQIAEMAGNA